MKSDLLLTPLERLLAQVDYEYLASSDYVPSDFAMRFVNFFKMIDPHADDTPPFHYAMLDKFEDAHTLHVNMCHRGAAKTTLMGIRMLLWLAIFRELPGNPEICNAIYVSDSIDNGVKTLRKNMQSLYDKSPLLQDLLPTFNLTENYLSCINKAGETFEAKFFGVLTGIRGTQINNERPMLAIMDDLMSDKNAASPAYRKMVNEVVYAGVLPAMNPAWHRVVLLGTPFDHDDLMVKAVSSGEWNCSVFPVCEKFPCTEEEFVGSWESRFGFPVVEKSYKTFKGTGNITFFQRELMLRLGSPDAVMVPMEDLHFYDDELYCEGQCNFIITTDFAFTDRESADDSVISVWAVTPHNNLLWVDGSMKKQTMDKNMDDLVNFCLKYSPIKVGVEVTGQQSAIVSWFRTRMADIGVWWSIASNQKSGDPGIRPTKEKLARFAEVAPWLRSGRVRFPEDWENYKVLREGIKQIISTTGQGIVTADDFLDTVSMLTQVPAYSKHDHFDKGLPEEHTVVDSTEDVYTPPDYGNSKQLPKQTSLRSYLV